MPNGYWRARHCLLALVCLVAAQAIMLLSCSAGTASRGSCCPCWQENGSARLDKCYHKAGQCPCCIYNRVRKHIEVIRKDEIPLRVGSAIASLVEIGSPAIPYLMEIVEHDKSARMRGYAARILGDIGDKSVFRSLAVACLREDSLIDAVEWKPEGGIRSTLKSDGAHRGFPYALVRLDRKRAIPVLIELLRSPRSDFWDADTWLWILTGLTFPEKPPSNGKIDKEESVRLWKEWWKENRDYLYWGSIVKKEIVQTPTRIEIRERTGWGTKRFLVNLEAKSKGLPVDAETGRPLTADEVKRMREEDLLMDPFLERGGEQENGKK